MKPNGLMVQYYNDTAGLGSGCPAPPGSVLTPTSTTATLVATQLEGPINSAVVTPGRPAVVNDDNIYGRFSGFITTTVAGDYVISIRVDDGGRLWFNQNPLTTTMDIDTWIGQGPTTYNKTFTGLAAATRYPVTMEWFEGGVTQFAGLLWTPPGGASAAVPAANLSPPDGPAAPTLNSSSPIAPPPATVSLSWNATAPAVGGGYIISRATTAPAGAVLPMRVIALIPSGTTTSYVDNAVTFGQTYDYIIQATSVGMICVGPASNTRTETPMLPAITVFPNTGLQTNENGASTTATVTFNQALPAGQTVTFTFTSNRPTEGIVSSSGQGPFSTITFPITGPQAIGSTFPLTIIGVDDPIVDGPQAYLIQCSTSGFFGAVTIPDLNCTNNDNDTPGITFSRTSGLVTTESGGGAVFTVVLNTQPTANVTMSLTSTNTAEGVVSPATLTFTTVGGAVYSTATGIGGWNVGHDVLVTGVDDALLDFTVAYSITTGALVSSDPKYNGMAAPDVACINLDNEVPPALPTVWGNGGCGLMGAEFALPLLLAAMLRRRRNR